ncbi:MAG: hypothetical protein MJA83_20565, partial [Gammaproteobacteria bacterium]|nr:hypothetical protein [Gammaproteobacteria bacterium]
GQKVAQDPASQDKPDLDPHLTVYGRVHELELSGEVPGSSFTKVIQIVIQILIFQILITI